VSERVNRTPGLNIRTIPPSLPLASSLLKMFFSLKCFFDLSLKCCFTKDSKKSGPMRTGWENPGFSRGISSFRSDKRTVVLVTASHGQGREEQQKKLEKLYYVNNKKWCRNDSSTHKMTTRHFDPSTLHPRAATGLCQ
jgi:hypothetical protein